MEWITRLYDNNWGQFILLFSLFIILGVVYGSGVRPASYHFKRLVGMVTSEDAAAVLEEEFSWQRLFLIIFSVIVLCLFYYEVSQLFMGPVITAVTFWAGFGLLAGLFLILVIIKIAGLAMLSGLFQVETTFIRYWREFERFMILFGLCCFPLLILSIYQPDWVNIWLKPVSSILLFLFLVLFLIRLVFKVLIESNLSYFQIILYLCTLEILPLLIANRWLVENGLLLAN